jgi:archaellum component FlaF (FlaF/FlaG flagellin family)
MFAVVMTAGCLLSACGDDNEPEEEPYTPPVETGSPYVYTMEVTDPYAPAVNYVPTPMPGVKECKIIIYDSTRTKEFVNLIVIVPSSASSLTGSYTVKAVSAAGDAPAVIPGNFIDVSWWEPENHITFANPSYYKDEGKTMYLQSGTFDIVELDGKLTITGADLGIQDTSVALSETDVPLLPTKGNLSYIDVPQYVKPVVPEVPINGTYPGTLTYTNAITTPATWGNPAAGVPSTNIAGSQLNHITVVQGNDTVVVVELITAAGATSLAGTYAVKDASSAAIAIGEASCGAYVDLSWFGMPAIVTISGSYFRANGEVQCIRPGSTITVTDNGGTLGISGSNLNLQDPSTTTAFGNKSVKGTLTLAGASFVASEPPVGGGTIDGVYTGALKYANTITTPATWGNPAAGVPSTEVAGSQLNHIAVTLGNDTVVVVELITAAGATSLAGTYAVKDASSAAIAIGEANCGAYLDLQWFGMPTSTVIASGSYFVVNGEAQYIRPGSTITVTDNGGTLGISGADLNLQDVTTTVMFGNKSAKGTLSLTGATTN